MDEVKFKQGKYVFAAPSASDPKVKTSREIDVHIGAMGPLEVCRRNDDGTPALVRLRQPHREKGWEIVAVPSDDE